MAPKRPKPAAAKPAAKTAAKTKAAKSTTRTASGKKADAVRMDAAAREALVAYKERVDEGRRASGMFPAVREEVVLPRTATDDAIGDMSWAMTEDARLLQTGGPRADFRSTDPWRV